MIRICFIVFCLVTLNACLKNQFTDGSNVLMEDFENILIADELISEPDGQWRFFQNTMDDNLLSIDTSQSFEGRNCLKFFATPTEGSRASKCSVVNNDLIFKEGETVYVSAHYYLEGNQNLTNLFLMDIEEIVLIGGGPGIRLKLTEEGYLAIDRSKMTLNRIDDEEYNNIPFPRNEWVEIELRILLDQGKKGSIQLYQNKELLLDVSNLQTLPKDIATFIQGTKGRYESFEIGITANSHENDATLFMDLVEIRIE